MSVRGRAWRARSGKYDGLKKRAGGERFAAQKPKYEIRFSPIRQFTSSAVRALLPSFWFLSPPSHSRFLSRGHVQRQAGKSAPNNTSLCVHAYLLIFWRHGDDIVHQDWHQFSYSMNSSCEGTVGGGAAYCLPLDLGLIQPFASYIVYDVEYSKLVRGGCLFEMSKQFLNKK